MARYVGRRIANAHGRDALCRVEADLEGLKGSRRVLLQFNCLALGAHLTHDWVEVAAEEVVLVSAEHEDLTSDAERRASYRGVIDARNWPLFRASHWACERLRRRCSSTRYPAAACFA